MAFESVDAELRDGAVAAVVLYAEARREVHGFGECRGTDGREELARCDVHDGGALFFVGFVPVGRDHDFIHAFGVLR